MNKRELNGLGLRRAAFRRARSAAVTLIVSAIALTFSACSSSGSESVAGANPAVASASTATSAVGEGSNVAIWTVSSSNKAGIHYLQAESTTGEDALTVYVFNKDIAGSGSSACDVSCAKTWPPLLLTDGATVRASGVTGTLGQLIRTDGTVQVTYNGAPLYFYVGDHGAGDANGQGVNAAWSAATP